MKYLPILSLDIKPLSCNPGDRAKTLLNIKIHLGIKSHNQHVQVTLVLKYGEEFIVHRKNNGVPKILSWRTTEQLTRFIY